LEGAKKVHAFVRDADDAIEWIEEKEMLVQSDVFGHDLQSVQALIVKHQGFEQDLAAISGQVESITKTAQLLLQQFPDASEHIHTKHEEMVSAWNTLLEHAQKRKAKLSSAESLQMYFNNYRELL
jgi:spectrin beta